MSVPAAYRSSAATGGFPPEHTARGQGRHDAGQERVEDREGKAHHGVLSGASGGSSPCSAGEPACGVAPVPARAPRWRQPGRRGRGGGVKKRNPDDARHPGHLAARSAGRLRLRHRTAGGLDPVRDLDLTGKPLVQLQALDRNTLPTGVATLLPSDRAAWDLVVIRARTGSALHQDALQRLDDIERTLIEMLFGPL